MRFLPAALFLMLLLASGRLPDAVGVAGIGSLLVPPALADDDDDDEEGEGDDDDDDDGEDDDDDDVVILAPPPPEFLVAVPDAAALAAIEALGYTVVQSERVDLIGADVARLVPPSGVSLDQAQLQIAQAVSQAVLDLNGLYRPEDLPCGPGDCAAFDMIGWEGKGACSLAPTIGMIDTGVNVEHPSFGRGRIEAVPLIGEGRAPASKLHGTAVALLMAGEENSRTPGILPQARIVAVEAFHRSAAGEDVADAFDVVRALARLAQEDVDALNMSFSGEANLLLERALGALEERGVPVVAAVGNAGPRAAPLYPAAYPQTVAVTAVDAGENVYRQANAGNHVDFAAPGVRLWTAASISGGRFRSGTSYAAPFVTAAMAIGRLASPEADVADLAAVLAQDAVDLGDAGRDPTFGWGLLQMPGCGVSAPSADAPRPEQVRADDEALPALPEGPR